MQANQRNMGENNSRENNGTPIRKKRKQSTKRRKLIKNGEHIGMHKKGRESKKLPIKTNIQNK
jgi:hypothetical protein